jgi:hypothetical protein
MAVLITSRVIVYEFARGLASRNGDRTADKAIYLLGTRQALVGADDII